MIPLKKYDLPEIDPETMTPQVTALVEFVKETLRRTAALHAQGIALQKELAQLQRAKRRAPRLVK